MPIVHQHPLLAQFVKQRQRWDAKSLVIASQIKHRVSNPAVAGDAADAGITRLAPGIDARLDLIEQSDGHKDAGSSKAWELGEATM